LGTQTSRNILTPSDEAWDITTQQEFNNVVNTMSTALISSLNSALQNPDNSGNSIAAEYSLFFPTNTGLNNNNSTN